MSFGYIPTPIITLRKNASKARKVMNVLVLEISLDVFLFDAKGVKQSRVMLANVLANSILSTCSVGIVLARILSAELRDTLDACRFNVRPSPISNPNDTSQFRDSTRILNRAWD